MAGKGKDPTGRWKGMKDREVDPILEQTFVFCPVCRLKHPKGAVCPSSISQELERGRDEEEEVT